MSDNRHRMVFVTDTELVEYIVDMDLDPTQCTIVDDGYSKVLYHY